MDNDEKKSEGPHTIGGHASHTTGAWIILIVIVILVFYIFK